MRKIDDTDMKILTSLVKDASISVPKLSKQIKVNPSVVYSRIKRLIKRRLITKFTVKVNDEMLGYNVSAIVGLNIDSKHRGAILDKMLEMIEIRSISEVTGRFDLVSEVKSCSLNELHHVISDKIGKLNGVRHTETFIEMKKNEKSPEYFSHSNQT